MSLADRNRQTIVLYVRDLERSRGVPTALCEAARWGCLPELKRLVHEGADPNSRDDQGTTALMYAASGGYLPTIRYLLRAGADVNARDHSGATALIWQLRGLQRERRAAQVVKTLLDAGADRTLATTVGEAAIGLAREKYGPMVWQLLEPDG